MGREAGRIRSAHGACPLRPVTRGGRRRRPAPSPGASLVPRDLLLKNFCVTRHGRVLFYDDDEISLLGDCRFRSIPRARYDEDEYAADPWFSVDEGDGFPEEFLPFPVPPGPLRRAFLQAHADLLTVRFWRGMQASRAAGDVPDIYPYRACRRLHADAPGGVEAPSPD